LQAIYVEEKPIQINPIVIPGYIVDNYEPYTIQTELTGILDGKLSIKSSYQGKINTTMLGATLINENFLNPLLVDTPTNSSFLIKENNNWRIPKGKWLVNEPLTINGNLLIGAGTHLSFSENAYLLVKGSIHALGTEEKPIKLTAEKKSWKGIYVFQAKNRSLIENVVIENTRSLADGLLNLSGGVTFYQADVDMENVFFDSSVGEDVLNIVKSDFELNNIEILNARSDGIDFDFSKGVIRNAKFNGIGGDALDFSGSQVKIDNFEAKNIKDKAVSAGEDSSIEIKNSFFDNIGVGLASKDGSQLMAENLKIENYQLYAAMSYVKKGFYSKKTQLSLNNYQTDNLKQAFFRQKGTNLFANGSEVIEKSLDVKSLYKSEAMKK
jgi:hypothetical protein